MLADDQIAQLSSLAQRFRAEFAERLGRVAHAEEFTDRYELVIPPAHPAVGELRVRDDGDELTVSVGAHHWHVPLYMYADEPEDRRVPLAAVAAVHDVRDVLEGRTVIRVTRRGGRVASTSSYSVGYAGMGAATPDDTEYVWTGPRVGRR